VLQGATVLRDVAYVWSKITYSGTYQNTFSWASRTPERVVLGTSTVGASYVRQNTTFDAFGNVLAVAESGDGVSRVRSLSYFANTVAWVVGLPLTETIGTDLSITRSFNTSGQMLSETKNGVTTTFGYTNRYRTSETSPRGFTTTYADFYRGVPRQITLPIGATP
jgi:hypothetical protein